MGGTSDLPPRFPCWCQATYSWGGETKKDLGFIEGDLIEALNAGDGQWWMGRLRRDPRAVGLFPSNFVKVLENSFQPAPNSRNSTPSSQQPAQKLPARSPLKNSVFRKPFQAYEEVGKRGSLDNAKEKEGTPESDKEKPKKSKFKPYSSMKTAQAPGTVKGPSARTSPIKEENKFRIPEPPPRGGSRRTRPKSQIEPRPSASPTPTPGQPRPNSGAFYRAASPQPTYRAPSPQPAYRAPSPQPAWRAPSPQPMYRAASPQPMYRAASPQPMYRAASPAPIYRASSPAPSRSHSPLPTTYHDGSAYPRVLPGARQPSPNPYQQQQYMHPAAEDAYGYHDPRASFDYDAPRMPSPAPFEEDELGSSPPPPPPPAHRVVYQPTTAPSPQPQYQDRESYSMDESRTPARPSPNGGHNMTPSPLRDAMNDVMSSLQDMSVVQDAEKPARAATPAGVWSPDAYELVRRESKIQQQQQQRAQSSLGFASHDRPYSRGGSDGEGSLPSSRDGPPGLNNYVSRMEHQLRQTQSNISSGSEQPPAPPLKGRQYSVTRPTTSSSSSSQGSYRGHQMHSQQRHPHMRHRKSAHELGRDREDLNRTYTTKTNITNSTESSSATQSSNSTQLTGKSVMSGYSAGGFSATSAGSLRKRFSGSQKGGHPLSKVNTKSNPDVGSSARSMIASESSGSGPSYHESHASANQPLRTPTADWTKDPLESANVFGGLSAPKSKKSGFFKKMIESAKTTARTGAANARSTMGSRPGSRPGSASPTKSMMSDRGPTAIAGGLARPNSSASGAAKDPGIGGGNGGSDWMQVRRDINRSNTLSQRERDERAERCEMLDIAVINPIDQLHELVEGDESLDGLAIADPTDFNTPNLALVDKSTRFIQSVPPMCNPSALAQSYVCRPHRSDVQRLRAIFTWVSERITWEEDFEGQIDTRRVVQTRRGCDEEIAVLVRDMCNAVGLHSEVVRGYLKAPGEVLDLETLARPNHWWNAVIVDGEWRIMDCALAAPSNPKRGAYSSASSQVAEPWYFLARPLEICYTHIPLLPEQQHIVPPVAHEILMSLPCACPTYFRHGVELADFDTSLLFMENLEMTQLHLNVPEDVECVAETEARGFAEDADGDVFESGEMVTKKALAQPEWIGGRKRITIKALLPGDEGRGTLKIYAGKRGLMHTIKDNPHSLALALPLAHTGQNPPYTYHTRHPTPHAQRHDLYVAQPQCAKLVLNNTFVFTIRQHPSSLSRFTPDTWGSGTGGASGGGSFPGRVPSPSPYARPTSAMSMVSANISTTGSLHSLPTSSDGQQPAGAMTAAQQKPAKLAIQTPSQKIIRLTRKQDFGAGGSGRGIEVESEEGLTTAWETVIKIGERGTWRGLVLADRSARWCVFAEWECV